MLASCSSANIQYVSSVPQNKLCTLYISKTLAVKNFNGENVDWTTWSGVSVKIQIPEGNNTFVVDYSDSVSNGYIYANDISVTHTFVAGKTYYMLPDDDVSLVHQKIKIIFYDRKPDSWGPGHAF
jgi:hypothetical protein